MAQPSGLGWTRELMLCCSFVLRRAFIPRFVLIRPRFSGAARLRWPSSRSLTRYSQTAAGDQTYHTFWSGSRKRTELWFGTRNGRVSGSSSPNLKPRTKCIPALQTRLYQGQEKRSEEHTSELQSRGHLVCRLLLEKKKKLKMLKTLV